MDHINGESFDWSLNIILDTVQPQSKSCSAKLIQSV